MNEDLLNVMGSFSDTALDCIEKQNEEIEQLQQENQSLKDRMKMINELLKQYTPTYASCVKLLDEIELFAKGDK